MRLDLLRRETYQLLALAFRRPTPDGFQLLACEEAASIMNEGLATLPGAIAGRSRPDLALFLAEARTGDLTALAGSLTVEYCRLFVGPYSLPCPPYGSVYLDGGQVMGPRSIDAASRYREQGLRVARGWREPPDHIAVELAFMARLSGKYVAAADSGRQGEARRLLEIQRRFLHDHVGRWGPTFAERLRGAASCHLYRFLGEFLPVWLAFDQDLLEALEATELREGRTLCASGS